MSNPNTQVVSTPSNEREVSFLAFGSQETVKLSIPIIRKFLAKPTRSGKEASDGDCVRFMMLCRARSLNPFEGDAFIVGFDGQGGPEFSIITAQQAFLKRAEASDDFDGMESGVIVKDVSGAIIERTGDFYLDGEIILGGWANVYRKNVSRPFKSRLRLSARKKNTAIWTNDTSGMIVKCFDEQTEILTSLGFESFATAEGRIIEVTDAGLRATDAVPFAQEYTGPMIANRNQNLDFVVTPNHDMITDRGVVEAGAMFRDSTQRNRFRIPRCITNTRPDNPEFTDASIMLAAVFLTDGTIHCGSSKFRVGVSRPHKIAMLEDLPFVHRYRIACAGKQAQLGHRTITTKSDKVEFYFPMQLIAGLVGPDKRTNVAALLSLSHRQARLLVDTMIECDGNKTTAGTRRFYSSRAHILQAFEIASVAAGFCVSPRKARQSDIGGVNHYVTISERREIGVSRVSDGSTAMETIPNPTGRVWCVTVPSHRIIVRRKGFSFICGNCAESDALRLAFPTKLGGMFLEGEGIDTRDVTPPKASESKLFKQSPAITDTHEPEPEPEPEPTPEPAPKHRTRSAKPAEAPAESFALDTSAPSLVDTIKAKMNTDGVVWRAVALAAERNGGFVSADDTPTPEDCPEDVLGDILRAWSDIVKAIKKGGGK